MSSINTFSPPPNEDNQEYLTYPYEFRANEYHDAWKFSQLLNLKWPYINYSEILEDVVLINGHPETRWIIFFNVRTKDAAKLKCMVNQFSNAKLGYCYILQILPWGEEVAFN